MECVISLPTSQYPSPRCSIPAGAGKPSRRLLNSLSATSDPSTAVRLVRKFVASSSKSSSLQALSFLISHSSPFSLHLYQFLSETSWFQFNSKLIASLISLLEDHHCSLDALTLISQSTSVLRSPRDLSLFYCDLIDAFSGRGLKTQVLQSYARLKEIPFSGKRPYQSIIKGMCLMEMPEEAEEFLREMGSSGFKPSPFEFRLVFRAYGRAGAFAEMTRVLQSMEENGMALDTLSANTVLSCYGDHGKLSEMVSWIQKIRESGIGFSFRTVNSVLNSCPTIAMLTDDVLSLPLSIDALFRKVEESSPCSNESLLLRELVDFPLLCSLLDWSDSEVKLDLHGLHLVSAYVIILQWMREIRSCLVAGKAVPLEFSIICGSGKHSRSRGESPVKKLVSVMMFQLKSPLKIDRKNVGKFVAKGKKVKDWLC
ncbi:pentatricopeptide repeat-containing protein At2g17033 [Phalaenopsis equestris]|uniref:pentatricopeptide repeat-containing protein At2g17033 n=1 Tax=Phalaenopsis equestris TaxID=78828 RepID=UPI0009E3FCC7|nr:pentatricopeptide repeat-containing protein At2g17033 [Phalaenopsis equestris]